MSVAALPTTQADRLRAEAFDKLDAANRAEAKAKREALIAEFEADGKRELARAEDVLRRDEELRVEHAALLRDVEVYTTRYQACSTNVVTAQATVQSLLLDPEASLDEMAHASTEVQTWINLAAMAAELARDTNTRAVDVLSQVSNESVDDQRAYISSARAILSSRKSIVAAFDRAYQQTRDEARRAYITEGRKQRELEELATAMKVPRSVTADEMIAQQQAADAFPGIDWQGLPPSAPQVKQ